MNDYWHIPRASLSPSSASSAVSSASSTQRSHRSKLAPTHYRQQPPNLHNQPQQLPPSSSSPRHHHDHHLYGGRSSGGGNSSRRDSDIYSPALHTNSQAPVVNNKRGSRSSQGSNDSNNSTRVRPRNLRSVYSEQFNNLLCFFGTFSECRFWFFAVDSSKFRTYDRNSPKTTEKSPSTATP